MAHRAHDRYPHRRNTPHYPLVVVGREILAGAAAATHDHHVESRITLDEIERADDALRSGFALHDGRGEHEPHVATSKCNRADVVERSAVGTRHDADDPRIGWKGSLSFRSKQALREKPSLQRLERLEQRSATRWPCKIRD